MQLVLDEVEIVGLLANIVAHVDWVSDLKHTVGIWRKHAHLRLQVCVLTELALLIDHKVLGRVLFSEDQQKVRKCLSQVDSRLV